MKRNPTGRGVLGFFSNPSRFLPCSCPGAVGLRTRRSQSGEDWFFGYVLGLVSVNQPKPRECYQFTKADRKDITKQVQNPSKQILRQYNQHKKDFRDVLKIIKIEKKMNKKERDEKLGNQGYWQDKLIGLEFIDKDDKTKRKKTWVVDKVVYSRHVVVEGFRLVVVDELLSTMWVVLARKTVVYSHSQ